MQIIPTVIEKDFFKAESRIGSVRDYSKWIQIDVCDGIFCNGKSFELELLNKLQVPSEDLLWDVHLMVKNPQDWIEKCLFVGANRITGQVEMMENRDLFIKTIKDEGLEAGLAFDVDTEIDEIPDETDLVILMGRKAGFEALELDERIYKKINMLKERKFLLAVDGGVNAENISKLKELQVDVIYSGGNYFQIDNAT